MTTYGESMALNGEVMLHLSSQVGPFIVPIIVILFFGAILLSFKL